MPRTQKKQKMPRRSCRREEDINDGGDDYGDDRLSDLPDEILILILSRVTLREAVSSHLLSQRWRGLWTYISVLNFDPVANNIEAKSCLFNPSTSQSQRRYVDWVRKILEQYRGGQNLDEFRICFDLAETSPSHINDWFEYAMSKNISLLEFNFLKSDLGNRFWDHPHVSSSYYFFRILAVGERWDPAMNPNPKFVGFQSLTSLSLKFVKVSCEAIEYFLYNCPLLQRLSVHGSSGLYNLRIIGPSLMLKHLEIVRCFNVLTIEICNTNLVSFTYSRYTLSQSRDMLPYSIVIRNSPHLVEVFVGIGTLEFAENMFFKLSCCVHQLQILEFTLYHHRQEHLGSYLLPKLRNLKQLKLILLLGGIEHCLLGFVAMLKSFPHLESFILKLERRNEVTPLVQRNSEPPLIRYSHQDLKVVKIIGFNDFSSDYNFVEKIIEIAIALKKIIIDTREGHKMGGNWLRRAVAGRTRAEQLKLLLPPNLEFIVL